MELRNKCGFTTTQKSNSSRRELQKTGKALKLVGTEQNFNNRSGEWAKLVKQWQNE